MAKLHVKKNDTVKVISGKEKGKSGKILKAYPAKGRIIIEHLNMIKKHTKRQRQGQGGGIIEREGTIHASNVMLVCPGCKQATRIGKKILEDGSKVRTCKKCGEVVDR
ncbi:50S ribosomal protein L24 [candidate division KSB3 bacterium]|uniref:Large ribosomal subunit protein uL24 n=1 Tax=candidate division KSB3 bacterium TaxID=2044937 RepID=A0A2G6E1J8_9BACT|nr:MAG: 50S ribosomal protein L24 [candidate division KSB3 bacterium]PIE28555.1 MAG: 50S ribosomal protein L24 [candidate division KSB3 bacterium]